MYRSLAARVLTLVICLTAHFAHASDTDICLGHGSNLEALVAACTRALASAGLSPAERSRLLKSRGKALTIAQDHDRAIADFTEALRVNPKDAEAYLERGTSWLIRKDYDKAIEDYSNAVRLDPQNSETYRNRAPVWFAKRDYDRAIADYSEVLQRNPKHSLVYIERGEAWAAKGDYDRAIEDYSEALRLKPRDGPWNSIAHAARGYAWAAKRDYDRALADYNEALRTDPKAVDYYQQRGRVWLLKEDYDRAAADFTEALNLNPKATALFEDRGLLWMMRGDYQRAISDFREAVQLGSRNGSVYNNIAWLLATAPLENMRNGAQAVEFARRAAELSGWKSGQVLDTLAAAYAELGNFAEAVSWQEKALADSELAKTEVNEMRQRLDLYRKGQPYRQAPGFLQ